MKKVSRAYKQAMNKRLRDRSHMVVTVGIVSNEAQATARIQSSSHYLSDNNQLFKNGEISSTYATLEQNVFKLDGSMIFPPENTGYQQLASGVGFLGEAIKGAVTIGFDKPYDIKGLTINFGEFYPRKFTVVTSNGTSREYTNTSPIWTTEDSFNATSSLTITPSTFTNGNSKRLRIESILMGIGIVFQNEDIVSASFSDSASFISEELPQMDFNITCYDTYKRFRVDDSNSFINYLEAGQEIVVSLGIDLEDGTTEFVNLPLTYLSSWSSNNDKVAFTSVDRFAFLTGKYTSGNYIHRRTLYQDAVNVLEDAGLEPDEYEISDFLRSIEVVNPLPEVSHAECLQLIANAGRCLLKQDDKGMICLLPNFENILEPEDITVTSDTHTWWSIPDNIKKGASVVYADMTNDFFATDGSMVFLPPTADRVEGSGYVSRAISGNDGIFTGEVTHTITDEHGNTTTETTGEPIPRLMIELPTEYTFYGIKLEFANPIKNLQIYTLDLNQKLRNFVNVDAEDTENGDTVFDIVQTFDLFQYMIIAIGQTGKPYQRAVLQKVSFGNLSEYELTKENMSENPIGTVEPKTQSVSVKVFTFAEGQSGEQPQALDDNVYSTFTVNPTGENITFENQLISTQSHAQDVARWIANYYANNVTYEVNYRGEPRIESADYLFMESEVLNNLQVEVESHTIEFNGAISGKLELRRATNVVGD